MSNTYDWKIYKLNVFNQYEGQQDVVFGINWALEGTDGTYSASFPCTSRVSPYTQGQPFIPFESLTKDIVVGWLTGSMTPAELDSYYQAVNNDIAKQQNPPPVESALNPPWLGQ